MNKLPLAKRAQIIGMMVEGMSIRSIVRMTGASKNTIAKLIVEAGTAFAEYQDQAMHNLPCKRVQIDEIWSFVGAKEKNASPEQKAKGFGDIWTWTAICADTKLIPSFYVGERDGEAAMHFIDDLSRRMAHRIQLSSDGHKAYLDAVEGAFGGDIDYAMIVKMYGTAPESAKVRYSPAECTGIRKTKVTGNPDPEHVSTSYAERTNLSIRMGTRRFTRLTNAFSKKAENHAHAIAIYFVHYNFVRIHQTLRCTPAMAAGVSKTLWSIEDMVAVVDQWEAARKAPAAMPEAAEQY